MSELHNIERMFHVIERSLFFLDGKLDYSRITLAITRLANMVRDVDADNEAVWSIGEYGYATLDDLIVGAYWHYTEWYNGQWSDEYAALSALSEVYNPGMTTLGTEYADTGAVEVHSILEQMAA